VRRLRAPALRKPSCTRFRAHPNMRRPAEPPQQSLPEAPSARSRSMLCPAQSGTRALTHSPPASSVPHHRPSFHLPPCSTRTPPSRFDVITPPPHTRPLPSPPLSPPDCPAVVMRVDAAAGTQRPPLPPPTLLTPSSPTSPGLFISGLDSPSVTPPPFPQAWTCPSTQPASPPPARAPSWPHAAGGAWCRCAAAASARVCVPLCSCDVPLCPCGGLQGAGVQWASQQGRGGIVSLPMPCRKDSSCI
jgi:hypothetical protein